MINLITENVETKERIDKYISNNSNISRNDIKTLIEMHAVSVNGIEVRKNKFNVKNGDLINISKLVQKEMSAKPENIEIDVIFEDKYLAVINKKSGMVVHPAPGHPGGTLVNALLHRFKGLSNINGDIRPGIVHRIDKDTSGLLVVAKENQTHKALADLLRNHEIKRIYYAIVEGKMENKIYHINLPIARDDISRKKMIVSKHKSKNAVTHIYTEKIVGNKSLVRCELETGRTHQIRVHLNYIKHPVFGDPTYGSKVDDFGQRLHAYKLSFIHPITKEKMYFEAPLPKEFDIMKQQ
ncbi:MAG: RluA family pseudouridine synthase [Mollicutes bacterium PWAP]|nr:RluA family pseudouridine synthase [Mollicutes bacterium PWAP]